MCIHHGAYQLVLHALLSALLVILFHCCIFCAACATISQTQFRCKWNYILKGQIKKITLKVTAETAGEFTNIVRVRSPNDTNPDNNHGQDRIRALVGPIRLLAGPLLTLSWLLTEDVSGGLCSTGTQPLQCCLWYDDPYVDCPAGCLL